SISLPAMLSTSRSPARRTSSWPRRGCRARWRGPDMTMRARAGIGYDIHAKAEGRPLVLGGVTIESPWGLAGHSDADVLAHAIGDALLGAIGLGDIGQHFPPGDPAWKNVSSMELLRLIHSQLHARGARIVNVDATVVAEAPRIAPLRGAMCDAIAGALW